MLNSTVPLATCAYLPFTPIMISPWVGDWCVVTPILLLGHFTSFLMSASCSKHLSQPLPRLIQPHTEQYPLNTGSAPPSTPKLPTGGTDTQSGGTEQQDSFFSRRGVFGSSSLQQTQGLVATDNKDVSMQFTCTSIAVWYCIFIQLAALLLPLQSCFSYALSPHIRLSQAVWLLRLRSSPVAHLSPTRPLRLVMCSL